MGITPPTVASTAELVSTTIPRSSPTQLQSQKQFQQSGALVGKDLTCCQSVRLKQECAASCAQGPIQGYMLTKNEANMIPPKEAYELK